MVAIDNSKRSDAASSKRQSARRRTVSKKAAPKIEPLYCICKGKDDGRPMIRCENCNDWFHFECINMATEQAEEIGAYICTACHEKTGLSSTMEWEGNGVLEMVEEMLPKYPEESNTQAKRTEPVESPPLPPPEPSSDEEDVGSGDEYVEEGAKAELSGRSKKKNRRQVESSDDEESDSNASDGARKTKTSAKRKVHPPSGPSKRQKTITEVVQSADEDPARKYCVGKLKVIINNIFQKQRPFVKPDDPEEDDEAEEEHKRKNEAKATKFAEELEHALFENFSEVLPGKSVRSVAGKYKGQFRTLSFNLDKSDRESLHKRIAADQIPPDELAKMTSAELASEHTKQEIQQAHQEAMNQSIIESSRAVPLVKRTHKGEEVIETFAEEIVRQQKDEEEKREREWDMRTKKPSLASPVTPLVDAMDTGLIIGAGMMSPSPATVNFPPLPTPTSATFPPGGRRTFFPLATNTKVAEPELDLSELIDIDLPESPKAVVPDIAAGDVGPVPLTGEALGEVLPNQSYLVLPSAAPATSPPPLSAQPGLPNEPTSPHTSFSLDLLWSKPSEPEEAPDDFNPQEGEPMVESPPDEGNISLDLDSHSAVRANDQDFDMLLAADAEKPSRPEGEVQKGIYEELPVVWTGTINMPYDMATTYSPLVTAKQIAGRSLGTEPALWKQLFPSINPTIDGRVPTAQSIQYLVTSRMNATRELIAVAMTPESPAHRTQFEQMFDFLLNKDRHGLIFPWGKRPKHEPPGRELYVVPLTPSSSLPEFIDLLDDLKLPQSRTEKMLLGLWVLHKGRLVKPSVPAPVSASASTAAPQASTSTPPGPPPPPATAQQPAASVTNPSIAALLEGLANIKNNPGAANINPTALKEEISSLDQNQIQHLARILLPPGQQPPPNTNPVPGPSSIPPPPLPPSLQQAFPLPGMPPPAFPPFPPNIRNGLSPLLHPPPSNMPPPNATPPHFPPPPMGSSPLQPGPPPPGSNWSPPPPLGYPPRERDRGGRGRGGRDKGRDGDGGFRRRRGRGDRVDDRGRDSGWGGRGRGQSPPGPGRT